MSRNLPVSFNLPFNVYYLTLLFIFLTPSFQVIPRVNNYFLFTIVLSLYSILFEYKDYWKVPLGLFIYILFYFCVHSAGSGFNAIGIGLTLVPFTFISIKFIFSKLKSSQIESVISIFVGFNLILCCLQLIFPAIGFSNINSGYNISTISSSAVSSVLTFLPSFGRLRGLFNENGPMVSVLLLIILHDILKLRLSRNSLKNYTGITLPSFRLIVNIMLILLTGSKFIFVLFLCLPLFTLFPIKYLKLGSLYSDHSLEFSPQSRHLFIIFLSLFVSCSYVLISIRLIEYVNDYFPTLMRLQSFEQRLDLNFSPLLFGGSGLLPSTMAGGIGELSAALIYSKAFGILPAILLLSFPIYISFLSPFPLPYLILLLSTYLASGSLLAHYYFVFSFMVLFSSLIAPSNFIISNSASFCNE